MSKVRRKPQNDAYFHSAGKKKTKPYPKITV